MLLRELKEIIRQNKRKWYIPDFFWKRRHEISEIKKLHFFNRLDQYELTNDDLFELMNIISNNHHSELNHSIARKICSDHSYQLFVFLKDSKLINKENFSDFIKLPFDKINLLFNLFVNPKYKLTSLTLDNIELSGEIFQIILHSGDWDKSYKAIQNCLILLDDHHLISKANLQLIFSFNEFDLILKIAECLDGKNLLNKYFSTVLRSSNISQVSELLHLMKNILDEELLVVLLKKKIHWFELEQLIPQLVEFNNFNKKNVIAFLARSVIFQIELSDVLAVLKKNLLLNPENFKKVFVTNEKYIVFLEDSLRLLSDKRLLLQFIFDSIFKIQPKNFHTVLYYLNFSLLLNKTNLLVIVDAVNENEGLINLINIFYSHRFVINNENLRLLLEQNNISGIIKLFNVLLTISLANNEYLKKILMLSEKNFKQLDDVCDALGTTKFLDAHSFDQAFELVSAKLPPVIESRVKKTSRRDSKAPRSKFQVMNPHLEIFTEHNKNHTYRTGGMAKVKKGFMTVNSNDVEYAIKTMRSSNTYKAIQEGKREVKYHRLLNRHTALFFQYNGHVSIVSDWLKNFDLANCSKQGIMHQPVPNRLKWIISGVSELKILHDKFRVHGDIKSENFILELATSSLKLIDFGAARKRGSTDFFVYTLPFIDRNKSKPLENVNADFCDDVYAMSFVIAEIFPDFFQLKFGKKWASIDSLRTHCVTPIEHAMHLLIKCMQNPDREARCTCADIIAFCDGVLKNYSNLTKQKIKEIAITSIKRTNITLEDVFHGLQHR